MLEKITALLLPARVWLDANGGPGTAFGVLIVSVFLTMYGLRKWAPTARLWERIANVIPALDFDMTPGLVFLRKAWQGLFPTMVAAVAGALASGGNVKVAMIGALAGPITVFGHELAKWVPFLPYQGKVNEKASPLPPARDNDDDPPGPVTPFRARNVTPVDRPEPPFAACVASLLVLSLMAFFCACGALTPQDKSTIKTLNGVAQDLCLIAQAEQHASLSPKEVLTAFCETDAQLAPFIEQLIAAKHAALAPPEEAKAPKLTGCAAAVERGKALQCPLDEPDAGGWCSTRTKTEVDCLSSAKSCLAFMRCTEVSK